VKVLVTGTSGFIGTSFCERCAGKGPFDVVGVDRRPPRERFASVNYIRGDLTDGKFVRGLVTESDPDAIVHFAAQARVDPSLAAASPTYADNVVATLNLIEAAEDLGHRLTQFVYVSSETVYGDAPGYPCPETSPLNPQSPYAASKAACELLVSRALPGNALILRSGMGYGPRSDPSAQVVGRFICQALTGRPILFPKEMPRGEHPTRDVNYVSNFLDGLELALGARATGTFNVASGQEVSILDLANEVVKVVGKGSIECSDDFHYRAGEAGVRTWLDISKARDSFGYTPKVPLRSGLRTTVRWYASNPDYFEAPYLVPVRQLV
jgi:nucleoside-diphosphate-sugar epimerase